MRKIAILQARMTSTRLPGKILMDLAGKPMLEQQVVRLLRCARIDELIIATTSNATDDAVVALARKLGVRTFRGDEGDVLSRYVGAARKSDADIVVRVTADCPLIEPSVVDRVVLDLESQAREWDYASNVIKRTYPRGLDVEAFFMDVLERVNRLGKSEQAREHVTQLIVTESPELFRVGSICDVEDNSDLSWTVDTQEDLALVRTLYQDLGLGERALEYREILAHARRTLHSTN